MESQTKTPIPFETYYDCEACLAEARRVEVLMLNAGVRGTHLLERSMSVAYCPEHLKEARRGAD